MLYQLYNKFKDHYPEFLFGYLETELYIKLSVYDKRSGKAKKDIINLDSSQQEIKVAWYKLLKDLYPDVKASQGSEG